MVQAVATAERRIVDNSSDTADPADMQLIQHLKGKLLEV